MIAALLLSAALIGQAPDAKASETRPASGNEEIRKTLERRKALREQKKQLLARNAAWNRRVLEQMERERLMAEQWQMAQQRQMYARMRSGKSGRETTFDPMASVRRDQAFDVRQKAAMYLPKP